MPWMARVDVSELRVTVDGTSPSRTAYDLQGPVFVDAWALSADAQRAGRPAESFIRRAKSASAIETWIRVAHGMDSGQVSVDRVLRRDVCEGTRRVRFDLPDRRHVADRRHRGAAH